MDRRTLADVDGWLAELLAETAAMVERHYDPATTTPQQTAYQAGKAAGIRDARAWIELQARQHGAGRATPGEG